MNAKPLVIAGAVGVALFALSKVAKAAVAGNLNFVITKLGVGGSLLAPKLKIEIGVQNPSSIGYTLQSLSGNVYINDTLIGNASNFDEIEIESNAETLYNVAVRVSLFSLAQEIVQVFSGKVAAEVRMIGTVNVENYPFPLNLTHKII